MKRIGLCSLLSVFAALQVGCGQEPVELPETSAGGHVSQCGDWYPAVPEGENYDVAEGAVFPCVVWEPARLDGQDTYINAVEEHLAVRFGASPRRAMVVVVSAKNCSNCTLLIRELAARADDLDDAGALMVAMARRVFMGSLEDEDFDIDEAEQVLAEEGWLLDRWYAINDAQHVLDRSFDEATPWVIVVDLETMEVLSADNSSFEPTADGAEALVSLLRSLEASGD